MLLRLLQAESIKLLKRRLYWIMGLVLAALVGLTALLFLLLPRVVDPSELEGFPVVEKPEIYLFGVQQVVGQTWFPVILAVVLLAAELSGSTWMANLTREARRGAHLAAKAVVVTVSSWVVMVAAVAGWAVLSWLLAEGEGGPAPTEWLGVVAKLAVVQLAWVALGLAVAAALRSTAVAVGVAVAFSFSEGLLALWRPYRRVSLSQNSSFLFGETPLGGIQVSFGDATEVTFIAALTVVGVWTIASLLAGWLSLRWRDA